MIRDNLNFSIIPCFFRKVSPGARIMPKKAVRKLFGNAMQAVRTDGNCSEFVRNLFGIYSEIVRKLFGNYFSIRVKRLNDRILQ